MTVYKVQNFTGGKFVDKKEISVKGIKRAKILTETNPEPGKYPDEEGNIKMQDVCKVKFEGLDETGYKVALTKTVINGLVAAFGEDSREWIGKILTVETEKTRFGGKAGITLYLIPEGYEKVDNEEGYAEIRKIGLAKELAKTKSEEIPVIEEDIDVKNIEF